MIDDIYEGIRTRLVTDAALVVELGGSAVYAGNVPQNAVLPYVVMQWTSGGDTNMSAWATIDGVLNVRCLAETGAQAGTVAALIRDRLHEAAASIDLGTAWEAYRCQHRRAFAYVEHIDRSPYFHAGGQYRIRATRK